MKPFLLLIFSFITTVVIAQDDNSTSVSGNGQINANIYAPGATIYNTPPSTSSNVPVNNTTVPECQQKKTGTVCFENRTSGTCYITVHKSDYSAGMQERSINAGSSVCYYNISSTWEYKVTGLITARPLFEGDFQVDVCNQKTILLQSTQNGNSNSSGNSGFDEWIRTGAMPH